MLKHTLKRLIPLLCLLSACEVLPETSDTPSPAPGASSNSSVPTSGVKPNDIEALTEQMAGAYARRWKLESRYEGTTDAMQDCDRDDNLILFRDHRITFDIGQYPCRKGDKVDKDQQGRWQPTADYDLLVFVPEQSPFQVKILDLGPERLSLSYREEDGAEFTETYRKAEDLTKTPSAFDSPPPSATPSPIILKQ
ncbi:MAG: hypothetical protein ACAI44_27125 [Candidatus Sericytochromatia bacterium]